MSNDPYKSAYEDYQRQVEKRWPDAVIAPEWDALGEEMQTCWRAGFESYASQLESDLSKEKNRSASYKDLWDKSCQAVFELCDLAGAPHNAMKDLWTLKACIENLVQYAPWNSPASGEERGGGA